MSLVYIGGYSGGIIPFTGGDIESYTATGGTLAEVMSDSVTSTYVSLAAGATPPQSFKLYVSNTADLGIPSTSTVTDVRVYFAAKKSNSSAVFQFNTEFVQVDSGGSTTTASPSNGPNSVSGTSWEGYVMLFPTAPGGGAWTITDVLRLSGSGNGEGYLKFTSSRTTAGTLTVMSYAYARIQVTFTLPTPTISAASLTGYTITAPVTSTFSLKASSSYPAYTRVRYGTSSGVYPYTQAGSTYTSDYDGTETIVVDALSPSTTYYCVFDAYNADVTATSSQMSFTTAAGDAALMRL